LIRLDIVPGELQDQGPRPNEEHRHAGGAAAGQQDLLVLADSFLTPWQANGQAPRFLHSPRQQFVLFPLQVDGQPEVCPGSGCLGKLDHTQGRHAPRVFPVGPLQRGGVFPLGKDFFGPFLDPQRRPDLAEHGGRPGNRTA